MSGFIKLSVLGSETVDGRGHSAKGNGVFVR